MVRKGCSHPLFLLLSLLLLARLEQLSASRDNERERKREAKQAALEAFEELYVRRQYSVMPHPEVVKKLKEFEPFFWESEFAGFHKRPVLGKLSHLLQISVEFCLDRDHLSNFSLALKSLERPPYRSVVLHEALKDILTEQRRLCKKEYERIVGEFEASHPEYWSLLSDLSRFYRRAINSEFFGWWNFKATKEERRNNSSTFMISELLDNKLAEDKRRSERVAEEARKLLAEVDSACRNFKSEIGEVVRLVTDYEKDLLRDSYFPGLFLWQEIHRACDIRSRANIKEAIDRVIESRCELWREAAEKFKAHHARDWLLIGELEANLRELPPGKRGQRRRKLAVPKLLEKGIPGNGEQEARQKMSKQELVEALKDACKNFLADLGPMFGRAFEVEDSQPEARRLLYYEQVCEDFVTDRGWLSRFRELKKRDFLAGSS